MKHILLSVQLFAVLFAGVLAGALMLGGITHDYFTTVSIQDLSVHFRGIAEHFIVFFRTVTIASVAISLLSLILGWKTNVRSWLMGALICEVAIGIFYFIYFGPTNSALGSGMLDASTVSKLHAQWAMVHVFRMMVGMGGFLAHAIAWRKL